MIFLHPSFCKVCSRRFFLGFGAEIRLWNCNFKCDYVRCTSPVPRCFFFFLSHLLFRVKNWLRRLWRCGAFSAFQIDDLGTFFHHHARRHGPTLSLCFLQLGPITKYNEYPGATTSCNHCHIRQCLINAPLVLCGFNFLEENLHGLYDFI